jgi:glycine cleavage system aminomethyltransferase T
VARVDRETFQIGANGLADLATLRKSLPDDGSVQVRDVTGALCCLGLWGPRARDIVQVLSPDDWSNEAFPYYTTRAMQIGDVPVRALRVSYVGELGWEIYASPEYGAWLWDLIWEAGRPHGLIAAGRAAFETMRLEKGYRLWGTDMHPEHQPAEAGVAFAVKMSKDAFRGREALASNGRQPTRRLACLRLDDSSAVMMGKEPVLQGDTVIGYVTSAGMGYSVGESLAYAWIPADLVEGAQVTIESFGEVFPAQVVREPRWDAEGSRLRV